MVNMVFASFSNCDHIPTEAFSADHGNVFSSKRSQACVDTNAAPFLFSDPFERNFIEFSKYVLMKGVCFMAWFKTVKWSLGRDFSVVSCAVLRREPLEEVGGIAVKRWQKMRIPSLKDAPWLSFGVFKAANFSRLSDRNVIGTRWTTYSMG